MYFSLFIFVFRYIFSYCYISKLCFIKNHFKYNMNIKGLVIKYAFKIWRIMSSSKLLQSNIIYDILYTVYRLNFSDKKAKVLVIILHHITRNNSADSVSSFNLAWFVLQYSTIGTSFGNLPRWFLVNILVSSSFFWWMRPATNMINWIRQRLLMS